MLDELEDSAEQNEAKMHSIQEAKEEDELEHYSRGMRTGSSIEDDEAEEFNKRVDTHFEYTEDARDDIDEMPVAGTQTRVKYQQQEEAHQQNDDYEEDEEDAQDYENYENEEEFDQNEPEETVKDMTIPIEQPQDATQFSVHNSGSKYDKTENIEISQETAPVFINHNVQRPDETNFSVKNVEHQEDIDENEEGSKKDENEEESINDEVYGEIVDETPNKNEEIGNNYKINNFSSPNDDRRG